MELRRGRRRHRNIPGTSRGNGSDSIAREVTTRDRSLSVFCPSKRRQSLRSGLKSTKVLGSPIRGFRREDPTTGQRPSRVSSWLEDKFRRRWTHPFCNPGPLSSRLLGVLVLFLSLKWKDPQRSTWTFSLGILISTPFPFTFRHGRPTSPFLLFQGVSSRPFSNEIVKILNRPSVSRDILEVWGSLLGALLGLRDTIYLNLPLYFKFSRSHLYYEESILLGLCEYPLTRS